MIPSHTYLMVPPIPVCFFVWTYIDNMCEIGETYICLIGLFTHRTHSHTIRWWMMVDPTSRASSGHDDGWELLAVAWWDVCTRTWRRSVMVEQINTAMMSADVIRKNTSRFTSILSIYVYFLSASVHTTYTHTHSYTNNDRSHHT